jgi:hypothetical protein
VLASPFTPVSCSSRVLGISERLTPTTGLSWSSLPKELFNLGE